jgi:hypothetical protein
MPATEKIKSFSWSFTDLAQILADVADARDRRGDDLIFV